MTWRPIETAPTEGEFLAIGPYGMAVVNWFAGLIVESSQGYWDGGGWTHWMPLPDAPTT